MERLLRLWLAPWTAGAWFDDEAVFRQFLARRHGLLERLRMALLVPAAACLVIGMVLDHRPMMLLTTVPLVLVLAISLAMGRIEAATDGQDHTKQ